jgi:hypothetical protein
MYIVTIFGPSTPVVYNPMNRNTFHTVVVQEMNYCPHFYLIQIIICTTMNLKLKLRIETNFNIIDRYVCIKYVQILLLNNKR